MFAGAIANSPRYETGRTEISGEPLDSKHETLRISHASCAAVEEQRDVVDQSGTGDDDHGCDRKRCKGLHQGEAFASDASFCLLRHHGSGLPSRIVSAVTI
jgi:hypothetical protein